MSVIFPERYSVKHEIKKNLSLSIPLVASQLIYALSSFIGTAMVSHLGKDALAASVLVTMIWLALSVLFFGMLNSVSVLISHQYGAKDHQAISETMGQSFLLGLVVCVFIILILLCMPLFLQWSSQPPAVLKLASQYMFALLWTIPGLITLIITEQFLAGVGRAKIVLHISFIVVPIEIPLIYFLIFGKGGLPACGIAGVGYGFAVTYTATAIGILCYLWHAKQYQSYGIFKKIGTLHFSRMKELIRIGLPMGFMHVIEVSTFTVATFWIAQFGTTPLAAHQIVMQYLGFAITITFAMSQALTVRVGHVMGELKLSGIHFAIKVGILISVICTAVVASGFYFYPHFFIQLDFNIHDPNNMALLRSASLLLSISAVLMLIDNFRIMGFGALRGLKDTRFPMYASFVSFWLLGLPSAYLLGFVLHLQASGVWWGLTFGILSGAIIIYCRLRYLLSRAPFISSKKS